MSDVLIGEYKGYRIFLDENSNQIIYHEGKPKNQPFFDGPPQLTVTLQMLDEYFHGINLTDDVIEKYQEMFHHYLYEISEVEHNIMVNRRLFYLDNLIKKLMKELDEELIRKGIHKERVYTQDGTIPR